MRVSAVGGVSQQYRITVIGGCYKVAWRAVLTLHAGCLSSFKLQGYGCLRAVLSG